MPKLLKVLFLTGLRSLDCRQIRWEEVNLGAEPMILGEVEIPPDCIYRPSSKGSKRKNFIIRLPEAVQE